MPLREARPTTFRMRTLSDAVDSTNGPQGAMLALQNLVPAPFNRDIYVPRSAAQRTTAFGSFTGPIAVELQYVVGPRVYGFVQSTRFAGKSEPFVYDYVAAAFITLAGVTSANCPTSTSNTGDWIPPTAAQIGGWVIATHPGFPGSGTNFGWFDISGFSSSTITGSTHTSTTIDTLSTNPIAAGVTPGMSITDSASDIPANTTVVSLTSTSITISAAATGSHAGTTLTIGGGTLAAPRWAAGNLNGHPLPSVPRAVANFAGSAWYAVGTALQFSDAGNPLQESDNPNPQVVNYQNGLTITALNPSPFLNSVGSIAQSLLVFQGAGAIQQVTGSAVGGNLATQLIASGEGTLAPNSLAYVPNIGTAFISPDGLQFVTLAGIVTPAIGTQGDGVAMPFINAVNPSRMCAAWNEDTLRIAVQNNTPPLGTTVTQEFWYHTKLQSWSGPHSFTTSLVTAKQTSQGFVISSVMVGASLWLSDAVPNSNENYVENGFLLQCSAVTSLIPDNQAMSMSGLTEMTIGFASLAGMTATVSVTRENGQIIESITIPVTSGNSGSQWNVGIWGGFNWGAAGSNYAQYQIPWSQVLLFKQCFVGVAFPAGIGNLVGNLYMRIKRLGYLILGENDAA